MPNDCGCVLDSASCNAIPTALTDRDPIWVARNLIANCIGPSSHSNLKNALILLNDALGEDYGNDRMGKVK